MQRTDVSLSKPLAESIGQITVDAGVIDSLCSMAPAEIDAAWITLDPVGEPVCTAPTST